MIDKEWKRRLGFCKRCGRFGRVYGGLGERGYSLCNSCMEDWLREQAEMFDKYGSPLNPNSSWFDVKDE